MFQVRVFNEKGLLCEHKTESTMKDISSWMHHYMHGFQIKGHKMFVEHLESGKCMNEQVRFEYFDDDDRALWGWKKVSTWSFSDDSKLESLWPDKATVELV